MRGRKAGSLLLFALLAGAVAAAPARAGDDAPPDAAATPQQKKAQKPAQKPAPRPKKKKKAPPDRTAPRHPARTAAAANEPPVPALPGLAAPRPLPGAGAGVEASAALLPEGASEGTLVRLEPGETLHLSPALVTVVVMAALPARYVEKRDPAAACGGSCGIVVNRGP